VKGRGAQLGGIAGTNEGSIAKSSSAANITGYGPRDAGGLVGFNYGGSISTSFSTGVVSAPKYVAGGLVGVNSGASIVNSYATGAVTAKVSGGLVGQNSAGGQVAASYATGTATASGPDAGGFVGLNDAPPAVFTDCYWDTTTSGTAVGVGSGDATGVTGLTTDQLVSGLPSGFASAVWAENPAINGGRPYLLSNRPR
jgi:hypothetical protein